MMRSDEFRKALVDELTPEWRKGLSAPELSDYYLFCDAINCYRKSLGVDVLNMHTTVIADLIHDEIVGIVDKDYDSYILRFCEEALRSVEEDHPEDDVQ